VVTCIRGARARIGHGDRRRPITGVGQGAVKPLQRFAGLTVATQPGAVVVRHAALAWRQIDRTPVVLASDSRVTPPVGDKGSEGMRRSIVGCGLDGLVSSFTSLDQIPLR